MAYIHSEDKHNLHDPNIIVPEIMRLLRPTSVIDFGCGIGTFLKVFKNCGVKKVLGIEGKWTNKALVNKYLEPYEFMVFDLQQSIFINNKFDLAISLEVAEHLDPNAADTFVANLVAASNVVLFSAAIPKQGGQNHINEQWITYWEDKFRNHGFILYDVIRPIFWDNNQLFWWYRQNMVVFAPPGLQFHDPVQLVPYPMRNIVHPALFSTIANRSIIRTLLYPVKMFLLNRLRWFGGLTRQSASLLPRSRWS
jgi:SAM-dependent methyltransferase